MRRDLPVAAVLDRVVEPLELGVCFGRTLAQFGDMRCSALRAFLPAVEHGGQDLLEAPGLQKAPFDVIGRPTADGKGAELWTVTPKGTIAAQATATLA